MIEKRELPLELRITQDEGQPVLEGYAVKFNELSKPLPFYEKFSPGAFADLEGRDILALQGHDMQRVLGRTGNGTLFLAEDDIGLRIALRPNTETSYGRDLVALVKRGDVTGISVGFRCEKDTWGEESGRQVRTVSKALLEEVSIVGSPAYSSSQINQITMRSDDMTKNEREIRQKVTELEQRQADLLNCETVDEAAVTKVAKEIRDLQAKLETADKGIDLPAGIAFPTVDKAKEQRQALNHYLRTGEIRQQTLGVGAEGGFTADGYFHRELTRELADLSCLRQIARVLPPVAGGTATFPIVTDADAAGRVNEGALIPERSVEFGQLTLTPQKYGSMVYVTNELLNDTAVDLTGYLTSYFAESLAAAVENDYWNAAVAPTGILDGAVVDRIDATANNTVVLQDLLNLYVALPAKYRKSAAWVCHPTLEQQLISMTDATGRLVFVSDYANPARRSLLGLPVYFSDEFPGTIAPTLDIMAIGDFKRAVYVVDSSVVKIERNDSAGFDRDMVAFRGIFRTCCGVAVPNALRVLRLPV